MSIAAGVDFGTFNTFDEPSVPVKVFLNALGLLQVCSYLSYRSLSTTNTLSKRWDKRLISRETTGCVLQY